MLSVILYGRNDNHGYNYHKRLAISLNSLSLQLSEIGDEIIFVDYNTPNDLPTIIEAIQDTLTSKTQSLLRILRVRPSQHNLRSPLPLIEPVARNVGIRRSNPENKWILSTNIDMIFIPEDPQKNLSTIIKELPDGFYGLPRFEIPEHLWEVSFERSHPEAILKFLRNYGTKLHLHTITRKEGFLLYDNPGDFQLMLRTDLFKIQGFDESMIKGWHVDANLAKRMDLLGKRAQPLEHLIKGYHCNHTLKESALHSANRTENSWKQFVDNSSMNPILTQENWGIADEAIEEISLKNKGSHAEVIARTLHPYSEKTYDLVIDRKQFNYLSYSPSQIFSYLADHLANLKIDEAVAYIGHDQELLRLINHYLKETKPTSSLLYLEGYDLKESCAHEVTRQELMQKGFLFIFDFHKQMGKKVMTEFCSIIKNKKKLNKESKFIGINTRYTDYFFIFLKYLDIRMGSHVTGICYGYLKKGKRRVNRRHVFNSLGYFVVRYLHNYTDAIRKMVQKTIK